MANVVEIIINGKNLSDKAFKAARGDMIALESLARKGAIALAGLGAAAAASAAAGLVVLTKEAIDSADATGKLAQKAGIAVEDFSRLSYATHLSEVGAETFQAATKHLSDELVRNGRGSADVVDEILKLSDQFAGMADGATKTSAAVKLFGKSGQEMIPFLNQGSEAIKSQMEQAQKLGLVIGRDFANNADHFNDNLDIMKAAFHGIFLKVAQDVLPTLNRFSDRLVKVAEDGKGVENLSLAIIGAVGKLQDLGELVGSQPENTRNWATSIGKWLVPSVGLSIEAFDKLIERGRALRAEAQANAGILPPPPDNKDGGSIIDEADTKKAEALLKELDALRHDGSVRWIYDNELALKKQLDGIDQLQISEGLRLQVRDMAEFNAEMKRTKYSQDGGLVRADMDQAFLDGDVKRFKENLTILEGAEADSLQKRQALMNSYAELRDMMRTTETEKQTAAIQAEIYSRQHWLEATRKAFGDMATAATVFGKKGATSAKVFASAGALIDTYASANAAYKAMAGIPYVGPALAVAAAAAAVAAGLANVAKINSTNVAHGGLDFVPEDSTFLLKKGERVVQPDQNIRLERMLDDYESGRGGQGVVVQIDGHQFFDFIYQASRDGRMRISSKAVI